MAEGQFTACKSNIKNIATALEMYSTDWSGKYVPEDRGLSLLTPNYLKTIPECPAAKSVTYSYDEGLDAELNGEAYQDYYMLRCKGGHHKVAGAEGDLPAYNGDVGLMSTNEELVAQTKVAEAARKAREAEEQ